MFKVAVVALTLVALAPGNSSAAVAEPALQAVSAVSDPAPTAQYAQQGSLTSLGPAATPGAIIADPASHALYTLGSLWISKVDQTSGAVTRLSFDGTAHSIEFALDATAHRLYALESGTQVAVIDTSAWSIVATFDVTGSFQAGIAVDPQTHRLFLSGGSGAIEALDESTGAVLGTASIGGGGPLAVDSALGLVYALTRDSVSPGIVTSLRTATLAVVATATTTSALYGNVQVSASAHRVFVDRSDSSILVLNGSDLSLISTVAQSGTVWTPTSNGDQIASVVPYYQLPLGFPFTDTLIDVISVATGAVASHFTILQTDENAAAAADPSSDLLYFGVGLAGTGYVYQFAPSEAPTPVYRFWSPSRKVHFYTASAAERDEIIANFPLSTWTYEGVAFSAFLTPTSGTVPLYRFWSARFGDHFYTTSAAERDEIIATYDTTTWDYEGIGFYVYPTDLVVSPVGMTQTVARFWSPDYLSHFYTSDATERDEVIATYPKHVWTYEGDEFRVPTS